MVVGTGGIGGVGGEGGSAGFGDLVDSFLVREVPREGNFGVRSESFGPVLDVVEVGDSSVSSSGLCGGVTGVSSLDSPAPRGVPLLLGYPGLGTSTPLTLEPGVLSGESGCFSSSPSSPGISRVLRLLI